MKKLLSIILAVVMLLSLAACGGGRADDIYVGNWISISGTAMGYTLTGEEVSGFGLNLEAGGKGSMMIEGDETNIKWTNDDVNLTVKVQGEELVGTIGTDTLTFVNLLNTGMDLTFAKEGTDAAKPENALPENEKAVLGTWTSYAVTDVLGSDASADIAADALTMTFHANHTCDIVFRGESITGQTWSMLDAWGFLEDSKYDFSWDVEGEELKVTYNGDDYWIFSCAK